MHFQQCLHPMAAQVMKFCKGGREKPEAGREEPGSFHSRLDRWKNRCGPKQEW